MDRDQFLSLPPALALRLLFDALDEETSRALLDQEAPKVPWAPKLDYMIYRQGGFQWASETSLGGLKYWHGKACEGVARGGQYLQNDIKRRDALARFISWRECYPESTWTGERNRKLVVARPPSEKPLVYERSNGGGYAGADESDAGRGETTTGGDEYGGIDPEADIPF